MCLQSGYQAKLADGTYKTFELPGSGGSSFNPKTVAGSVNGAFSCVIRWAGAAHTEMRRTTAEPLERLVVLN